MANPTASAETKAIAMIHSIDPLFTPAAAPSVGVPARAVALAVQADSVGSLEAVVRAGLAV